MKRSIRKVLPCLALVFLLGMLFMPIQQQFQFAAAAESAPINVTIILQVGQPNSTVNGINQEIDPGQGTAPVIVNDRVFVPIRSLVESMGGSVSWNGTEQKVTITLNDIKIDLWIGNAQATVNGTSKTLDAPPFISATGRTMLPLRFITENLGSQVNWDGPNQQVTIEYNTTTNTAPNPPANTAVNTTTNNTAAGETATANFSGQWAVNNDDQVYMSLTQNGSIITGTYDYYGQVDYFGITGTVTGHVLNGKFHSYNPATEWNFTVTMASNGQSFSGTEYYSNPPIPLRGDKTGGSTITITDFSGTWGLTCDGEEMYDLVLVQNGDTVTGYQGYDEDSGHVVTGKVTGNTLNGKFHTKNPVTEWDFTITMASDGQSFSGTEYYSNPPYHLEGWKK